MKYKKVFHALVFLVTLSLLLLAFPAGSVLAAPSVTIAPTTGPVGTLVSVTGTDLTPSSNFTDYFAYGTSFQVTRTGTIASANSTFDSFSVPAVPGGPYIIRVSTTSGTFSSTFTVTSAISLSTTSAHVGEAVSVSGTGFSANKTITILFDGTSVASATTVTYGSFSGTAFTVPRSAWGAHTVSVSDGVYTVTASLSVQQSISVSPTSGAVGSTVTVSGTGFHASYTITITFGGSSITTSPASITTNSVGDFSATFTVPAGASRTTTVLASDGIVSASTSFTLLAGIRLSANSGNVGASITVTGSGFSTSTTVTVSLDATQVTQATTDANGNFSVSFTVPASSGGAHTITASGGTFSASITFTVLSSVRATPTSGKVGSQIAVSGTGFSSSRSVGVSFDNTLLATVTTDGNGTFSTNVNIPPSFGGAHTITANDGTLVANGSFTTVAGVTISPSGGPMGAEVTVNGSGFAASSAITIQIAGTTVKNTTTDASGSFSDRFVVPQLATASYNISVTDGTNTTSVAFAITASFNISPTTGDVGSSLVVSGSGLSGTVSVKYDDTVVATVNADVNRAFSATFTVPPSIHGAHTISVSDAVTRLQTTFTMESTPPPIPAIQQPQTGARQGAQPTLVWTPVTDPSGVTYTLQIATDSGFSKIILEKPVLTASQYTSTKTERLPSVSKDSPYYWRVKAIDLAQNESDWSSPGSFYVSFLADWAKWTLIGIGVLIVALFILWLRLRSGRTPWA